jgi:hypothetical protein
MQLIFNCETTLGTDCLVNPNESTSVIPASGIMQSGLTDLCRTPGGSDIAEGGSLSVTDKNYQNTFPSLEIYEVLTAVLLRNCVCDAVYPVDIRSWKRYRP